MRFFNNLSIGKKFLSCSLFIAAIITAIAWQSVGAIENCHHACGMLIGGAVTTKSLAQSAQTSFYALGEMANQLLFSASKDSSGAEVDAERADALKRQFKDDGKKLSESLDGVVQALNADPLVDKSIITPLAERSEAVKNTFNNEYSPLILKLADAQNYNGDTAALSADFEKSAALSQKIGADIDAVFKGIASAGDDVYTGYVNFLLETILKLRIFIVIAAVFSVILMIVLAFLIKRPFTKMMRTLEEIGASWDMTKRFAVYGKDETGRLAEFFNLTFEKMRSLLKGISGKADALSNSGMELATNMNENAAAINEIAANIQNIKNRTINQSAGVTETTATMEQVTVNIEKFSAHVELLSNSVSRSSSAIEQMLSNIESVTQTLIKNAESVRELTNASEVGRGGLLEVAADIQKIARESEGLLEINSVMENIASQTNLLSMNAAIEAAHAGEAGKGFAVVAGEIRKLAESSSAQSKTIGTVLKKIKSAIDHITASTDNVLAKFEAIADGIKIVAGQEENIRGAMEEQGTGSKQILEAISHVNEITEQVKGGSDEMLAGSKEVIQESKNLARETTEISSGMNEMAIGAQQINVTINRVNELTFNNRDNIEALFREIAKFKV